MNKEEFDGIVLREKERSLFMGRVPKQIKEEFTQLAREEFCDDFGMAFKHIWDNYKLWLQFIHNFDIKLDYILGIVSNLNLEKEPDESKKIKMLNGKKIKKEVKNERT